jgi:AraC-like DNA-binding protein
VLITVANEGTRFCGHRLKVGQICVNFPGDDWDFLFSGEWVRIELPDDSPPGDNSERSAQQELPEGATRIINPKPAVFTQLLNRASQLLNRVPSNEIANGGAEQDLIVSLRDSLLSTDSGCRQHPRSAVNHRRIVLQSHQYMVNHIARPLAVDDVCRALDISERTLRYAFHDAFELSPMAYFKRMRLNAAHSVLKSHDRCTITVHEVAERFGFEHVGAFAADYRKLFGIYPSETLAPIRRSPSGS